MTVITEKIQEFIEYWLILGNFMPKLAFFVARSCETLRVAESGVK